MSIGRGFGNGVMCCGVGAAEPELMTVRVPSSRGAFPCTYRLGFSALCLVMSTGGVSTGSMVKLVLLDGAATDR